MAQQKVSISEEERDDAVSNLLDITQYTTSERDELLRRLLDLAKKDNTNDDNHSLNSAGAPLLKSLLSNQHSDTEDENNQYTHIEHNYYYLSILD